jgi:mRNA interferase MazF
VVTSLRRLDLVWAELGAPAGRRPVCILTRDAAIPVLNALVCAPITRTVRKIASEVLLGPDDGLGAECVIACDTIVTVPIEAFDPEPVGHLDPDRAFALDRALRYALDVRW